MHEYCLIFKTFNLPAWSYFNIAWEREAGDLSSLNPSDTGCRQYRLCKVLAVKYKTQRQFFWIASTSWCFSFKDLPYAVPTIIRSRKSHISLGNYVICVFLLYVYASLLLLLAPAGNTQRCLGNPFQLIHSVSSDHLTTLCALITDGSCIHLSHIAQFRMPLYFLLASELLFLDDEIQPSYSTRQFL